MNERIEDLRQRAEEALKNDEECLDLVKECEDVIMEEEESDELTDLQVVYWLLLDAHPGYREILEEMEP